MKDLKKLNHIPKNLNEEPLYPADMPIAPHQHSVNGKSIEEMFLLKCEDQNTEEEDQILKEWVIYWVNAPMFNSALTRNLRKKLDLSMDLDTLVGMCIEAGLDPF